MAAFNYTSSKTLATTLIGDFGRSVTIQKFSANVSDAERPWLGPGQPVVETSKTVKAVFIPPISLDWGKASITDEMLNRVEQVAMVETSDVNLLDFTCILDSGVRWMINWAQELKPGDVTVMYVFGVKR